MSSFRQVFQCGGCTKLFWESVDYNIELSHLCKQCRQLQSSCLMNYSFYSTDCMVSSMENVEKSIYSNIGKRSFSSSLPLNSISSQFKISNSNNNNDNNNNSDNSISITSSNSLSSIPFQSLVTDEKENNSENLFPLRKKPNQMESMMTYVESVVYSEKRLEEVSTVKLTVDKDVIENDNMLKSIEEFFCVICHLNLTNKNLSTRTSHLKKCAKESNISTKELLSMLGSIHEQADVVNQRNEMDIISISPDMMNKMALSSNASISMESNLKSYHLAYPEMNSLSCINMEPKVIPSKSKINKWLTKKKGWWSNKKSTSIEQKYYIPSYKKIQTLTMTSPIVVDGFQYACKELSYCYFLTHFHSDHYMGLDKSFDCGYVYCSPTTAAIIKLRLKVPAKRVISLELNKEHRIKVGGEDIKVQLTDANHCPGSVCLLFQFPSGKKVLHTGDFRWNRSMVLSSELFRSLVYLEPVTNVMESKTMDNKSLTIYLDTTYCNPNYNFPPQDLTVQAVIKTMRQEICQSDTLFLFGAYGIGKEKIYMAIAEDLNMKIHADCIRQKTMLCYDDWTVDRKERITTNANETCLWVVSMNQINFHSFDKILKQRPDCNRIVAFQPTGWTHQSTSNSVDDSGYNSILQLSFKISKKNHKIYSVPYSEHSSFSEIVDCIKILRPHIVVPTVNTSDTKVKQQLQLLREVSGIYMKK